MKNLGRNRKPREGIPSRVLTIPQGVLFDREEYHSELCFLVYASDNGGLKFETPYYWSIVFKSLAAVACTAWDHVRAVT